MDFEDHIRYEIKKSHKLRNATRLIYYTEALEQPGGVAIASFERFRGTWAFDGWFAKHRDKILAFVDEQRRRFQLTYTY